MSLESEKTTILWISLPLPYVMLRNKWHDPTPLACYVTHTCFPRFFARFLRVFCFFLHFYSDFIALRNSCLKPPPYPLKFVTPCHKIDDPPTLWALRNYLMFPNPKNSTFRTLPYVTPHNKWLYPPLPLACYVTLTIFYSFHLYFPRFCVS